MKPKLERRTVFWCPSQTHVERASTAQTLHGRCIAIVKTRIGRPVKSASCGTWQSKRVSRGIWHRVPESSHSPNPISTYMYPEPQEPPPSCMAMSGCKQLGTSSISCLSAGNNDRMRSANQCLPQALAPIQNSAFAPNSDHSLRFGATDSAILANMRTASRKSPVFVSCKPD